MRLLLPILFFLASIGIFFFYTNSEWQDVRMKSAQEASIVQANNDALQLGAVRDTLLGQMNSIPSDTTARLTEALPDNVDNIGLIININNIASAYGMTIKNTRINSTDDSSPDGTPSNSKYDSLSLSFTVSTDYDVFNAFLKDLESNVRLTDVTALTFSANDTGKYDFNVTIRTYWLK